MANWISSKSFKGVRYREHPTRKVTGGRSDKYFTIRFKVNGKLHEEAIGWASEGWNEAKAASQLAKLKESHRTGEGATTLAERREAAETEKLKEREELERLKRDRVSFETIFEEHYLPAHKHREENTNRTEKSYFTNWIQPAIGPLPLADIRPAHLEALRQKMEDEGKSPRTIQVTLGVIRQVFNYAARYELYEGKNPLGIDSRVRKPRVANMRVRYFTEGELRTLLDELKKRSESTYEIALLSLHSGLRLGEVLALTWGCVNLETGQLTALDTKNGETRHVPMSGRVRELFEPKEFGGPSERVFPYPNLSKTFDRTVADLKFNEGIEDRRQRVSFHTLRHTFASWCMQRGMPLVVLRDLLGHKTLAMTMRYAHESPERKNMVVDLLADAPG